MKFQYLPTFYALKLILMKNINLIIYSFY